MPKRKRWLGGEKREGKGSASRSSQHLYERGALENKKGVQGEAAQLNLLSLKKRVPGKSVNGEKGRRSKEGPKKGQP